jgi:hypothetical protein
MIFGSRMSSCDSGAVACPDRRFCAPAWPDACEAIRRGGQSLGDAGGVAQRQKGIDPDGPTLCDLANPLELRVEPITATIETSSMTSGQVGMICPPA